MEEIQIGLIGCGSWGRQYAQAFCEVSGVRLRAVVDDELNRAQAVAALSPGVQIYTDAAELCQDKALDGVIVVTPTPTHQEIASLALASGKHVLVEKPFSLSLAEALAMVSLAKQADRLIMSGQIVRFFPATREARSLIAAGAIGQPLQVMERRYGTFRQDPWPAWWEKMEGFLMLHLGSYSVDAILWLLDLQPIWAFAQGTARWVNPAYEAIDSFALMMGLSDEVFAGIQHEVRGGAEGLVSDLLIVGENGRLEIINFSSLRLNGQLVYHQEEPPYPPALRDEIVDFSSAIRENRLPLVSGTDVLATVATLDAAMKSLRSYRAEKIEPY